MNLKLEQFVKSSIIEHKTEELDLNFYNEVFIRLDLIF